MSAHNFVFIFTTSLLWTTPMLFAADGKMTTVELNDGTKVSEVKTISKKLSDKDLSLAGITVGKSKLSDVQQKFSSGEIYHNGDAGSSVYLLCYQGSDGTIAAFESSGEMGGTNHLVTYALVQSKEAPYRFKEHCSKSDSVSKETKSLSGLQLGMKGVEAKKIVGSPSKESPKLLLYSYEANGDGLDISSTIEIRLIGNKVSQFSFSKVESN